MGTQVQGRTYRLVISGYYGFRNSGDEAVLKSILNALAEAQEQAGIHIKPIVLSCDPSWTREMYGVEAAHRMRPSDVLGAIRSSDGLISGGGSLLQDATSAKTIPYYTGIVKLAQLLGKPTFIYSQGIGPVNRGWMNPLIRTMMKKSSYISVRDEASARLLADIGVDRGRIEVVPDPVMGLPLAADQQTGSSGARTAEPDGERLPVVGVSLRYWRKDCADLTRAASALALLARQHPVRLRFLPFHTPDDAMASEFVMERLGAIGSSTAELAAPGDDPQQMLLEVSRCDILFGMRLHALIYAANQQVPMLGLSYDPKIDSFLKRLGLRPVGSTDALDEQAFADAAGELLAPGGAAAWRDKHRDAILKLIAEAQRPAKQIADFLRQYK
ncbi:polysaccharide pyruvyl transferase CsaB [Paenibacillus tarimensis]|uniref:polysaccharide pyruvyl transferase CsaB n=1 Tax=Paenibacillus tarimensis TaxID=416012 RepID=UPI001F3871BE|nr:polysaccharide pyruvyl transferase CsaB [Paenibacillus tarimensis]MCF2944147.1 polysaccharide pyruvyl transferase CsaB [Paenibacillus tarimensis]